jgi:methylase of polypeptide subunit release factors
MLARGMLSANDAMNPGPSTAFDTALPQSVVNISEKERSNLFAWRGQFSPQLVEALLRAYAPAQCRVLDPFMGSGTALVEGAALGHEVHGCEVNPAAVAIGRLYTFCAFDAATRMRAIADADDLIRREATSELPLFLVPDSPSIPESTLAEISASHPNRHVRSLLQAAIVLSDAGQETQVSILGVWNRIKAAVAELPSSDRLVDVHLADARAVPLEDRSVDFVVSSPPYVNVFNYHHHYRRAVEALGWNALAVARSEIGSNRKFRQNRFLTVAQYCIDMALVLRELSRVCRDEARVILVVGRESNVEKTPVFNSELVASLSTACTDFRVGFQQERVFQNRFGQNIYEDLLHLVLRRRTDSYDRDETVAGARLVGRDALVELRRLVRPDRACLLQEAIDGAGEVQPSPLADSKHFRVTSVRIPT